MTRDESPIDLCPRCRKVVAEIHAEIERARNRARAATPASYETTVLLPVDTLCIPCLRKVTAFLRPLEKSPDA